jgi:transposase
VYPPKRYFAELLTQNPDVTEGTKPLLRIGRETIERLSQTERALVRALERDPLLEARVERLSSIPGIGPVTALTWALEIGEWMSGSAHRRRDPAVRRHAFCPFLDPILPYPALRPRAQGAPLSAP